MDFPMKTSDFPWLCKRLPEGMKDDFFSVDPPKELSASSLAQEPSHRCEFGDRVPLGQAFCEAWGEPTALEGAGKGRMKVGDLGLVHSVDLFVYPLVNSGKRISHSYPIYRWFTY